MSMRKSPLVWVQYTGYSTYICNGVWYIHMCSWFIVGCHRRLVLQFQARVPTVTSNTNREYIECRWASFSHLRPLLSRFICKENWYMVYISWAAVNIRKKKSGYVTIKEQENSSKQWRYLCIWDRKITWFWVGVYAPWILLVVMHSIHLDALMMILGSDSQNFPFHIVQNPLFFPAFLLLLFLIFPLLFLSSSSLLLLLFLSSSSSIPHLFLPSSFSLSLPFFFFLSLEYKT